jgi:hypothetical protein
MGRQLSPFANDFLTLSTLFEPFWDLLIHRSLEKKGSFFRTAYRRNISGD